MRSELSLLADPPTITIPELAKALDVDPSTVRGWITRNAYDLPKPTRVGGRWRWSASSLAPFLERFRSATVAV